MRKKGDLQFEAYRDPYGEHHGFARNTAGDTVAHVGVSEESEGDRVSWAMANKEGRVRAGPHMLLALMSEKYGLDPIADADLSHHGAMMARSAHRRGLIRAHPDNPSMRTNLGHVGYGASVDEQMQFAHGDIIAESEHLGMQRTSFNTGEREQAKAALFRKRKPGKLD